MTQAAFYFNSTGPMFVEDEWIDVRLFIEYGCTFLEGRQNVFNLSSSIYIYDEYGEPARATVAYGEHEATIINLTDMSETIGMFNVTVPLSDNGRIEIEQLNKTTQVISDTAWNWQAHFRIKFERSGSYGLKITSFLPTTYPPSEEWKNNTIIVHSTLEELQLESIYSQRETNERSTGLSYISIIIAFWSIIIATLSIIISTGSEINTSTDDKVLSINDKGLGEKAQSLTVDETSSRTDSRIALVTTEQQPDIEKKKNNK